MSGKVSITVEYHDKNKPSKTLSDVDVEDAVGGMRDLVFRCAVGEYAAVYITQQKPLGKYKDLVKKED